eukprot:IDg4705t1
MECAAVLRSSFAVFRDKNGIYFKRKRTSSKYGKLIVEGAVESLLSYGGRLFSLRTRPGKGVIDAVWQLIGLRSLYGSCNSAEAESGSRGSGAVEKYRGNTRAVQQQRAKFRSHFAIGREQASAVQHEGCTNFAGITLVDTSSKRRGACSARRVAARRYTALRAWAGTARVLALHACFTARCC